MTAETLPEPMLTRLLALGAALLEVARRNRDTALEVLEHAVLAEVRAAQGGLLEEVVQRSTTGLAPSQQRVRLACPGCKRRAEARDWRGRTVRTVCGAIRFDRPWYHCRACGHGWSPADATLGLGRRARLSVGLPGWASELGLETVFRQGSRLLDELSGQRVSPESIRRHSQRPGAALGQALAAAARRVLATREAAEPVEAAPGRLPVETDGVQVRFHRGGGEVQLGLVGGWVDGELVAPSYAASHAPVEAFGPLVLAEATRRGALEVVAREGGPRGCALGVLRAVTILGDGAVASLAKHPVQRRMKRAGMRWAEPGGEALLALLAHRAPDRPLPADVFAAPFLPRRLTPKTATAPPAPATSLTAAAPSRAA